MKIFCKPYGFGRRYLHSMSLNVLQYFHFLININLKPTNEVSWLRCSKHPSPDLRLILSLPVHIKNFLSSRLISKEIYLKRPIQVILWGDLIQNLKT